MSETGGLRGQKREEGSPLQLISVQTVQCMSQRQSEAKGGKARAARMLHYSHFHSQMSHYLSLSDSLSDSQAVSVSPRPSHLLC